MLTNETFCEPPCFLGFTNRGGYDRGVAPEGFLRDRLVAAGVRPTVLAEALGITKQHASMMLSGQRGIAAKHFERIANLLGVPLHQMFAESDLPRHSLGVKDASTVHVRQEGSAHDIVSARLLAADLHEDFARLRKLADTLVSEIEDVANRFARHMAATATTPADRVASQPPARPRAGRKTG
jgi:transcriptional regulator with XRE-family HTH domain